MLGGSGSDMLLNGLCESCNGVYPEVCMGSGQLERNKSLPITIPDNVTKKKKKKIMQRPANTHLSAKSITSMFLFLISIMYFRKSLLQKVLCLGKVWKQWGKQGNPIAQKINFAMQKKKVFG